MANPLRTTDQVKTILSDFFGSNAPDVLVQPGSGPQDVIDTFSQEMGRSYIIMTYNSLKASVAGLRDLISDTTESASFREQLGDALEMTDSELNDFVDQTIENFAGNHGLSRLQATSATTVLRFFTSSGAPGTIPLGTTVRTPGLNAIEYATSIDILSQPVIPDPTTGLYYIDVPATATTAGQSSRVPLNRVTQLSPPISGFTSVTNIVASSGGTDTETNSDLLDRCMNALKGRELDTIYGLDLFVRGQNGVEDALVIDNSDPLMLRGSGNEVDIYIIADNQQAANDSVTFNSSIMGDSVIINRQPVLMVFQVRVNGALQTAGVDYNFVKDTGGFAGSNIAVDKILFLPGRIPSDGDGLTIDYSYNAMIGDIQSLFSLPENDIPNSDVLIKEATEVLVDIIATIIKLPNFSVLQVQSNVMTAVQDFFDALKLGDSVYASDVIGIIENTDGVDHVTLTKLAPVGQVGVQDPITISKNQYARLNSIS